MRAHEGPLVDSKRSPREKRRCIMRLLSVRRRHSGCSPNARPEREAAMLRAVQEDRVMAQQALAGRGTETSAGREALAADCAALDSETGAMEAAVDGFPDQFCSCIVVLVSWEYKCQEAFLPLGQK